MINTTKLRLWRALVKTYNGKLFDNNYFWSWFGFAATAAVTAAIGYAFLQNYGDRGPFMLAGMLIPLIPIMVAVSIIREG
jgi:hypothetical protein